MKHALLKIQIKAYNESDDSYNGCSLYILMMIQKLLILLNSQYSTQV